ncbi:Ig-like domain-containing protein [Shewanella algidipiscicola]|uniref:Ig-like domain-containing protein n=1 Tax=Shewanella algidipiscicola TaxID=614070 RepID=UPI000D7872FF|nr:Ig-like domain-containing protein [Shewanella algidipiscicola]
MTSLIRILSLVVLLLFPLLSLQNSAIASTKPTSLELLVVDASLPQYQTLLTHSSAQWHNTQSILRLADLSPLVEQGQRYSNIHLITHGQNGEIQLAGQTLSPQELASQLDQLLLPSAPLYLYACNLAQDAKGKAFVDNLASILARPVLASTNATGNKRLGGDWQLEYSTSSTIADRTLFSGDVRGFNTLLSSTAYELSDGDVVTLTNAASALSNDSAFTLELWTNLPSVSGIINLMDITGAVDAGGFVLVNGALTVDLSNDFANLTQSTPITLSINTWYHFAFVFDSGQWSFYVNGQSYGSGIPDMGGNNIVPDYQSFNVNNLVAGLQNHAAVNNFTGKIDDIRLWSTARTQTEIQNNRQLELAGNETGLIGYWKLNETSGTVVNDSQTNGSIFQGNSSGVTLGVTGAFTGNQSPTDITLSNTSVNQSSGSNAVVGTLTTTDANVGDSFSYALIAGSGDTSNGSFNISGDSLRANNASALTGGSYSIRVQTTDSGNATFEKVFSITVVDDLPPEVIGMTVDGSPADTATSISYTVSFNELANNISTDDFSLTPTGSAAGNIASVSASSGTSVTVTINNISGNGSLRLDLKAATNINDAQANSGPAAYTSGDVHTVAVPTVPGAPIIGTASALDGQAVVNFSAPASDGGSAITSYQVTSSPGGITASDANSPIGVAGLTNGTSYTFTVQAINAVGTSLPSAPSNSVVPKANQTISFNNPGAQNFGTTPTLAATASSGLTPGFSSSTTGVCTITASGTLTFVTAGNCTIDADQAGDSSYNAAPTVTRSFMVHALVPGAPTSVNAVASDASATVSFSAPASTGGAAINGYTVTSTPGGITASGAGSPLTVSGLSNGTDYSFTVSASNTAGTGPASSPSNTVTPKVNQSISFSNPGAQSFGSALTLTATASSGLTPVFSSSTTGVCTITASGALTFVTTGNCSIDADQAGDSSYNAAPTVTQSFTVNAVVPGAPTSVNAVASDASATVSFSAPVSTGGAAISGYTVTSTPGGITASGAGSPLTVSGLSNGTDYSFTVSASNTAGTGLASTPSNTVTPKVSQSISFSNPGAQSFGTTPTLAATASSGLTPVFSSTTTGVCNITASGTLTFVTSGSCSINADQAGNSSYNAAPTVTQSFTVNAVVPGAPTSVSAVAADASATISFSAPVSSGGAAISGYTVTSSPVGFTTSGTASPLTVSGLSNGTGYSFTVSASNIAGTGPASSPSNTVTPEPNNKAPSISGTPASSVDQDSYYSFTPTATDPDQDPLTFSISNKPAWASFNTASGELSGTPLREHVGVSDNIIIRVSDGALSTDLAPFSVEVKAVNQAPQANHDRITQAFSQENSYLLDVLANDSDPDDDTLTIVDIGTSLGTATVLGDKLQLIVPENFNGQVRLSYSITDGEFYDSAKVSFSIEGSNPEAPVINIPADVTANATGLFTRVNLGRVGAIDSDDNPIPVSLLNGFPFFAPGQHLAYWKTTDGKGVSATASQLVTVYPRINLGASKTVANFTQVQVPVLLNGSAPEYPLEIRYSVSGDAIAGHHDLASGSLLLSQGMSTSLEFNVFADLTAGQQKSLTITLDDGQNPGFNVTTEIRISNENLAPNLSLSASQQGEMRSSVSSSDGLVTVAAEVADPNPADNISLSWSSEPTLSNLSASANEFIFDPATLSPGGVTLTLNAMDDGSPQLGSSKSLKLLLLAQLPALGETDANNNRLPDSAEGYGDPDGNGIPAYLQGEHPCNVIPEQLSRANGYLAEAQPGICSRKGQLSLQQLDNGIELEDGSMLPDDSEGKIVGGLFDFELEGSEYGGSVSIVIPQVQAIPAQAQYRKYVASGWQEFVTDANNQVFSSAGEPGYCPPIGDASWQSGLTEGHWCVQLFIQDGGPNDGDGQANGTIVDPGGVAVKLSANQAPIAQADSFSLPWNQQHLLDVLANDNDADNDSLYLVQASVSIGEVSVSDDKLSLMYTPPEDFIGNAQLSYTVSDGMGGTAMSHAELVVFYNRAPVVNDSSASTDDRTAIELDVLSTASDPDGDSLTLASASAQTGSVSITASQTLKYQPKSGFAGTDIISFSVSDGNGASANAQVVVTVTAYQEVVVENRSSGGAVALWALALMLLMAGFRRLSLRLASLPLLLLLTIGVSFNAQARWSVNLNLGYSHARLSESDINEALPAEVKLTELDKDDFAWSVALNYQANDVWALQFGYLDLGETSLTLSSSTLDPQVLQQSLANLGAQLASGVTAGAEYRFWRYHDWSFSLNGGVFAWESDFDSQWQQQELSYDDSGIDFYWGLGSQYQFAEQWGIRADYRRYMLDRNQVDGIFVGLEVFF